MRKYIVLLSLILLVNDINSNNILTSTTLHAGTIKSSYVINDSTVLYWTNQYDEHFNQITGYYIIESTHPLFIRLINGANDVIYYNTSWNKIIQQETFTEKDYFLNEENLTSQEESTYLNYKNYNKDKQKWAIYTKSNDNSYQAGRLYDINRNCLYNISTENHYKDDLFMSRLIFFLLVYFAYAIFLPFLNCEKMAKIWFFLGFVIAISSTIFLENHIQLQLILPLIVLISTSLLFKIPKYKGKIRYISQFIIGTFIICFFTYMQFFNLNSKVKLADGKIINIKWQQGTCLIKRQLVKNIFSYLVPVTIYAKNKKYVIYISKYEFSEGDFAIINNEILSWFIAPLIKRPLTAFSFRESQIVLEIINNLCGVKLDFLSLEEWKYVSQQKKHSPNLLEYSWVNKGNVNQFGLVNISDNVSEYTSNYFASNFHLGLAADTIIKNYNNIIVAGNAYYSKDSIDWCFVNKNIRDGKVGFRIVYRPENIGSRKFSITGYRCSEEDHINIPKSIKLIAIDGQKIEDINNYESFEELLIENRYKNRMIEAIDLSNISKIFISQPEGADYYDYVPMFSFEGINQ